MTGPPLMMSPRTGSNEPAGPAAANAGEPAARQGIPPSRGEVAGTVRSDDPLVDMVVRVHADFGEQTTLAEILAVIDRCRTDLDASGAAGQAALVEQLVRRRLTDRTGEQAAGGAGRDERPTRRMPQAKR